MTGVFLDLLNMSISASWMILAVLALRFAMKKAPRWAICGLWALVAVRLIFPFSIESVFSLIPSTQTLPLDILTENRFQISSGVPVIDHQINDVVLDSYYEGVTVPTDNGLNVMSTLTVVWLLGMAAIILYAVISYLRLRHKVSASINLRDNLYLCDYIESPFILGILFPKIYLPSAMEEAQWPHILAHEKAHLKRLDHWWKPLGFALLCLHWFNPLMWVAYVLLCRDIELACDEKVIKALGETQKKAYSEALLSCSVPRYMIAACPLAFGEVGVKERVKSVLNYKKPAFWIILIAIIACVITAVCFLTDPVTEPENTTAEFRGTVIESSSGFIIVEPEEGSAEAQSASKICINLPEGTPIITVGETVRIVYDGLIQETYPAQITGATLVQVLSDLEYLTENYSLNQAILDGCVAMVNGDVVAGQGIWQSFVDRAYSGQPASVRFVTYYTIGDPARMSAELFASERDSYPRMYVHDLIFDGEVYTIRWFEGDTEYTQMWKYLMHYTGRPNSGYATFESYDCYMLTDRNDVTYDDIWSGVYSADFRDQIAFNQVYIDRVYADEPTFRELEQAKDALTPYMVEYRIATLDANELTGRLDVVVYEWMDGLYELLGQYVDTHFVTVTEMRGTLEFTGEQSHDETPTTNPPGTYYRLKTIACLYMNPLSSQSALNDNGKNYVFDNGMFYVVVRSTDEILFQCPTDETQWQEFPFSQERWEEILPDGLDDLSNVRDQLWGAQYRLLSDNYCLFLKDGTLYVAYGYFDAKIPAEYFWEIHELTIS